MAIKKGKTYRTSSGKQVDFGALLLANETEPALGNMNVNARGDEIDAAGNITKSREQVMREYNELNTMVPQDDGIPEGTAAVADDDWQDWEPAVPVATPEPVAQPQTTNVVDGHGDVHEVATKEPEEDPIVEEPMASDVEDVKRAQTPPAKEGPRSLGHLIEEQVAAKETETEKKPTGGLAAAVAASKKVNREVQQHPQVAQREAKGVRRI